MDVIETSIHVDILKNIKKKLREYQIDIIHDIGRNFLDRTDYVKLLRYFSNDLLTDMINIIKIDILYDIGRNYGDADLTGECMIKKFLFV